MKLSNWNGDIWFIFTDCFCQIQTVGSVVVSSATVLSVAVPSATVGSVAVPSATVPSATVV